MCGMGKVIKMMTPDRSILSDITVHMKYAKFDADKQRRETWEETVARYFDFMEEHLKENTNQELVPKTRKILEDAVCNLEVMPSMRALMTAGKALEDNNIAGYFLFVGSDPLNA